MGHVVRLSGEGDNDFGMTSLAHTVHHLRIRRELPYDLDAFRPDGDSRATVANVITEPETRCSHAVTT